MNQADAALIPPESPAFSRTLDLAGARHWQDATYPYRLAGDGAVLRLEAAAGAGVVGMTLRPGYVRGEPVSIAILRDLAVEPAARGKGLAGQLVRSALDLARDRGAQVAVFAAPGPRPPLAALETGGDGFAAFDRVALLTTTRIVPALWRWEEPEYKIFRATAQDAPALAYMLDLYRRGLAFAPPTDETSFRDGVARTPQLAITDFRLARYKDEMVAMTGVWEPGPALTVPAPAPTLGERLTTGLGTLMGPLSKIPRLPPAGQALRIRFLRAFAIKRDHHLALGALLDRIANEARKAGAQALEVTLPEGSPLAEGLKGRVRRTWTRSLWALALTDEVSLADLGPVDAGLLDPAL